MGGAGECQGFIALSRTTLDEPFDTEVMLSILDEVLHLTAQAERK